MVRKLIEYVRNLMGVEELFLYRDYIIGRIGRRYCAHVVFEVKDISKYSEELSPSELMDVGKLYFRLLNLRIPIGYRVLLEPIDRSKILRDLNRSLQEKLVALEHDPANTKLQVEVRKLEKLREKIVSGFQPFRIRILFTMTICGENIDQVVGETKAKCESLRNILLSSGIEVEELRGTAALNALLEFFRNPYTSAAENL